MCDFRLMAFVNTVLYRQRIMDGIKVLKASIEELKTLPMDDLVDSKLRNSQLTLEYRRDCLVSGQGLHASIQRDCPMGEYWFVDGTDIIHVVNGAAEIIKASKVD